MAGVGGYGGTCKCPNGQTYLVGDNNDDCTSLACMNGQKIDCNRKLGDWSYRKVTCAAGTNKCTLTNIFTNSICVYYTPIRQQRFRYTVEFNFNFHLKET